jgi:hypothetical protein
VLAPNVAGYEFVILHSEQMAYSKSLSLSRWRTAPDTSRRQYSYGDSKMSSKTKTALGAAMILGAFSLPLATHAFAENNYADWPDLTAPKSSQRGAAASVNRYDGGAAYGYVAAPHQKHRTQHERTQDR